MECDRFRERLAAEPELHDPELERHLERCSACRAFSARIERAETRVRSALRIDPVAVRQRAYGARRRPRRLASAIGVAAAVGLATVAGLWTLRAGKAELGAQDLARAIVFHQYFEPGAWTVTDLEVPQRTLDLVLDEKVEVDLGGIGTVTFARSCWIGGEWVPHFVVQRPEGPIMIVLLPGHAVDRTVALAVPGRSLEGALVPSSGGSFAVLGATPASVGDVREAIAGALHWKT